MARRISKVPKHLQNAVSLNQQLAKVEAEDMLFQHPSFLGNQRQFIDRIYEYLPNMADKLVAFMGATPERVYGNNGSVQLMVPEEVALTDGQLQLFKMVLQKGLPNQSPVSMGGKQSPMETGKVNITINQTGPSVDFDKLSTPVDGVVQGRAEKVNTLSFKRPTKDD